jgi:hypothetical protein
MRTNQSKQAARGLCAALAITALAAVGWPGTAAASTTAGTTILNIVQVKYNDATGTGTVYNAAFSTSITVNLVKAGLNITTPPNSASLPGFTCLADGSYASGDTFTAYYAMTATANGQDLYNLSITDTPIPAATTATAAYSLLDYTGAVTAGPISTSSTRTLNSAIVVGTSGADTLLFPGGSLKPAASGGWAPNDIVVVDYGATKTAYLVKTVTLGNAKGYSISGAVASTTTGTTTAEVQDRVQVQAFNNNALGIGSGAVAAAPAFGTTAPAVGTVVGQMVLVKIDVTAKTNVTGAGNDAHVSYTLTTTDSSSGNTQYVGSGGSHICDAGIFKTTQLSIIKSVVNITNPAMTTTGNPGDILEYTVAVNNPGGQAALTSIVDNIPSYTKLVTFPATYGTAPSNNYSGIFATVTDGTHSVSLTVDGLTEAAAQPAAPAPAVGYGTAAGVAAGSALNFFLGQGSNVTTGGTVPSCNDSTKNTQLLCIGGTTAWYQTYTLKYRVQVN